MASHNTRGSVTTLHDFGGGLGRPLHTFFWALTISWSRLFGSCVKWPSYAILVRVKLDGKMMTLHETMR